MFLSISLVIIASFGTLAENRSQQLFQQHNAKLFNDLFTGYHRQMSPYNGHGISNDSYPLSSVTISLQYARLIRVLEPEHQHRNLIGVLVEWQDPRLQWNSSEYGGIDHIYVNRLAVWMPEFFPCESSQANVVYPDQSLSITVNASGFVNTFLTYSAYFSCEFDVYRFPFDKQECFYCFILYNYNFNELRFNAKFAARPWIYDTSEWTLTLRGIKNRESIDSDFNIGLVYYNITLTRKPQFWVGLVITPTFVIGSLIIIGLFFGHGTDIINNAVGLGLTTMMSMMAIVGILANALAKSAYIPVLGWYVIAEIVIITLAVLALMYSEMLCDVTVYLVVAACTESKDSSLLNSFKAFIRKNLLERGKHEKAFLFCIFFTAHVINIIVLFCR